MRARNLPHRASFIFVHNSAGALFVQQRVAWKETYPSHYDPAPVRAARQRACIQRLTRAAAAVRHQGGVVDAGESYEDNAVREVAEEMGVVGAPLAPLFDFYFADAVTRVWGRAFRATYDGPLTLQASEVAGGEWMSLDAAAQRARDGPCCPDSAAALAEYVRRIEAGELTRPGGV